MKTIRSLTACILIFCMALSLTACSGAESAAFPDGFDKYVSLLGLHEEPVLDKLGVTEADLVRDLVVSKAYALAEPVVFHGFSFTPIFRCSENDRMFTTFEYVQPLTEGNAATAESILDLAKTLTAHLGIPYQDGGYLVRDDAFLYQMTLEELEAWLTAGEPSALSNCWPLGPLITEETMAYLAWGTASVQGLRYPRYHLLQDYPTLVATMYVYTDGNGSTQITLGYELTCIGDWE